MAGFWSREKNDSQTLADLIRGLQHSVNAAMEMVETRNVELLGRYFAEDGRPLTKRLDIDDRTSVEVPIISIVNPSTINIKEVDMDFPSRSNPRICDARSRKEVFRPETRKRNSTTG